MSKLTWQNYGTSHWCADGDGFYVIKQNSTGFRMFSNNDRKYWGKRATLEAAQDAIEERMRLEDQIMWECLRYGNPLDYIVEQSAKNLRANLECQTNEQLTADHCMPGFRVTDLNRQFFIDNQVEGHMSYYRGNPFDLPELQDFRDD